MSEWKKNDGNVPVELMDNKVEAEVRYRDGQIGKTNCWNDQDFWDLLGDNNDIVEWRLV